jgi:hypothetical protein
MTTTARPWSDGKVIHMSMRMKGQDVRKQDGAVLTCTVADCSFNRAMECWAPQISVGEGHPSCDTFTHLSVQTAAQESIVAACGIAECDFNDDRHCAARGVTVSNHATHADCITFRP